MIDAVMLSGGAFQNKTLLEQVAKHLRLAGFTVMSHPQVAMPGGSKAIHEPWRNTYAHIAAAIGWADTGVIIVVWSRPVSCKPNR